MFKKILVALDHSKSDTALMPRIKELARLMDADILLLHVSTGWAAQWQQKLNLSDSAEMQEDREYLEHLDRELRGQGFRVSVRHSAGDAAEEILKTARKENCDLIAMTTHGHRFLNDLVRGTTITRVRHETDIPIFLVRASPD